jgi:circadian clock protein KaiC
MSQQDRISSGNAGLDTILRGGLPAGRMYLLEGSPGSGKTTLALKFLLEGLQRQEPVLYITLSESREELIAVADSHGMSLDGVAIFELASADDALGQGTEQSILHPWEAELGQTVALIRSEVERIAPARVVFDSLSELRLLAQDPLRFRRQVLALKQFFDPRNVTVMLVDDLAGIAGAGDGHLHSICHGVITLERLTLDFGAARRRLQVQKLRGVDFMAGFHDFNIRRGGLEVFPRLVALDHHASFAGEPVASGNGELDRLLFGGPLRGTTMLITGPAGTGKTNIALQYLDAACRRGEPCAIFEFDERVGTMFTRASALGFDLPKHAERGLLHVQQVDPAELSPGEFVARVREHVEQGGVRLLVIDSLNGYLACMPQEQQLILQLHELLSYLNQRGVTTLLINPQQGLVGTMMTGSLNVSYIADTVLLLRFFEAEGRIRKAISVLKNRSGAHEDAIRELRIDAEGLRIGEPLATFRGVLTGTPEYIGSSVHLLDERNRAS